MFEDFKIRFELIYENEYNNAILKLKDVERTNDVLFVKNSCKTLKLKLEKSYKKLINDDLFMIKWKNSDCFYKKSKLTLADLESEYNSAEQTLDSLCQVDFQLDVNDEYFMEYDIWRSYYVKSVSLVNNDEWFFNLFEEYNKISVNEIFIDSSYVNFFGNPLKNKNPNSLKVRYPYQNIITDFYIPINSIKSKLLLSFKDFKQNESKILFFWNGIDRLYYDSEINR